MSGYKPLGGRIITLPFLVLSVIALIGLFFLGQRFLFGLGSVSNLNQGYTWGIWIVFDVVAGTALACGGYAMAVLVYVLNKGAYHPLVRPALLASLLGYTLGGFSAFFDAGRYWQMYNIILPWHINLNSVMLEVAICVTAYILVLWIEFSPAFLERLGVVKQLRIVQKVLFAVVAVGVLLPTMHQSSLGSLLIAAGHKVSPLWQTDLLPLLFLISAIAMGYAVVIFEASLSAWGLRQPSEMPLLSSLSRIMVGTLLFFLVVRFLDLLVRGQMGLAFDGSLQGNMFWVEILLFFFPAVTLAFPRNRTNPRLLFLSAASLALAGVVYRFNAFLIGFDPGPGFSYFPSVPETMITLGIISIEILAYLVLIKKLPVMRRLEHTEPRTSISEA